MALVGSASLGPLNGELWPPRILEFLQDEEQLLNRGGEQTFAFSPCDTLQENLCEEILVEIASQKAHS